MKTAALSFLGWMSVALVVAAGGLLLSGCSPTGARVGVSQPPAFLLRSVEAPLTARRGASILIPPAEELQVGISTFRGVSIPLIGLISVPTPGINPLSFGWGDGSMESAMADGGIKEVIYADYREFSVLNGLYTRISIVAYGDRRGESAPPASPPDTAR